MLDRSLISRGKFPEISSLSKLPPRNYPRAPAFTEKSVPHVYTAHGTWTTQKCHFKEESEPLGLCESSRWLLLFDKSASWLTIRLRTKRTSSQFWKDQKVSDPPGGRPKVSPIIGSINEGVAMEFDMQLRAGCTDVTR